MSEAELQVLCVDDEPYLLAALQRALRERFAVATATSAQAALDLLDREGPFGVVISDMSMPGTNGIDFLRQVRSRWPHVARILLSGHGAAALKKSVDPDLVFRCLEKPFPAEELERAIDAALGRAERSS